MLNRFTVFIIALFLFVALFILSLFIGVSDVTFVDLWRDQNAREIFLISRLPRTIALVLVGAALSCAGLIMQLLTQNKFVEPATSGSTQSAILGVLIVTIIWPSAPIMMKMIFASFFAFIGFGLLFLAIKRMALRSTIVVPLLGIMIGAIIQSVSTFLALHFDLLQSISSWESGDFSNIIRGRYEILWIVAGLVLLAIWSADRFTIAGMGEGFSTNIGLNYRKTILLGLLVVAMISGVVVIVVGSLPFLGLVIPNMVSMFWGDYVRKNIPWICLFGGGAVLLCDILGRVIYAPYEIPVGTILGIVGAVVFLYLILRNRSYAR